MRDILLFAIVVGSIPFALTRPWLAILFWTWVSIAHPMWNVWGFMLGQPLPMLYAIILFASFFLAKEKFRFKWRPEVVCLVLLVVCFNLSLVFALDIAEGLHKWEYTMKSLLLVFAALAALNTKRDLLLFVGTIALSIGLYSVKGGIFTVLTGGNYIVIGPNTAWENNGWAVATIMAIPLIVYFFLTVRSRWLKLCLGACIPLAAISVFGSFSRGALVAITGMVFFLWLKSPRKIVAAALLLPLIPLGMYSMSSRWEQRMQTIETYQQDASAMGRINAWTALFNGANDRPLVGLGVYPYTPEVFRKYAPDPEDLHSAHSMYFEVLGENGYPALIFFLLMWLFTWRDASWVIRTSKGRDDLRWAGGLAAMLQVSFVGHFVGGIFLSGAYWEVPMYLLVAVVVLRDIVEKEGVGGPALTTAASRAVGESNAAPPAGAQTEIESGRR